MVGIHYFGAGSDRLNALFGIFALILIVGIATNNKS